MKPGQNAGKNRVLVPDGGWALGQNRGLIPLDSLRLFGIAGAQSELSVLQPSLAPWPRRSVLLSVSWI